MTMGTFVRFLGTPGLVIAFELGKAFTRSRLFLIQKGKVCLPTYLSSHYLS